MPTKYDVFAKIIEKAPCKAKDLSFSTPVYAHIHKLKEEKCIKETNIGKLVPIKNKVSEHIFQIIRWCINNNINYNTFFSTNIIRILKAYEKSMPKLRPEELSNNENIIKILRYFEDNQFILVRKLRPRIGTLLNHTIFDNIAALNEKKIKIKESFETFSNLSNIILNIKKDELNPFDKEVFEFLSGSAQLEGSTISIGETIQLLTKDIYPDKPAKDIQMIKNLNEAVNHVLSNVNEKVTPEKIKELNRLILFSLHKGAGTYKKAQNKIHGNPSFKTTLPHLVPLEIDKFCSECDKIRTREECVKKIGYLHNQLQRIHPFPDGNSRTTRLVVNWMLIKFQLPIIVLKAGSFQKYMSLTKLATERSDEQLRDFLLHTLLHENLLNQQHHTKH